MSRSVQYRRDISDDCNWHQDQALNSTIYIVYQTGPTGFLLKEENESKNFKVFLGSVHNCTCSVFKKEKDLCKHICWILLKKFRVPRSDPLSWQLGLNEREINQILRGDTAQTSNSSKTIAKKSTQNEAAANASNEIEQRPITFSDVCPICQDELLAKKLPVTYCRFGCGNNVHIKCMKVWADHQKSNGDAQLKCPLCRETFCSYELLEKEFRNNGLFKLEKPDLHYGITCSWCSSTPINGKCYKCTTCKEFYMCQACFNTDTHTKHAFVFREKINQKYRKATRDHVGMLPTAIVQSLGTREISEQDYDLLLQLDQANSQSTLSQIPEKVIKAWPCERVKENSKLLDPGIQCRICLRAYQPSQIVRKLPNCKHKFHADCIDNWLLHSHPTCPIDGQVVWDPVVAQQEKENKKLSKDETSNKKQESENKKVSKSSIGPSLDFIVNNKTYNNLVANGRSVHDVQSNVESMNRNESAPIGVKYNFQNLKRTFSSDLGAKKTSNVSNFQVEGRRLNNGTALDPMDDLTDFTNSLLMQYNLHNEPLSHASKLSSQAATRFNIKKPDLRRNKELSVMNNKRNTSNNIDVFDISALIQDKPYQLSKIHANQKHQQTTTQLNQMPNLDDINLADLVYNMDLEQEEPETHLNKSCTTNMSSSNTQQTLISTNNLIFQLGPSHEFNYQANHQPHHFHQQQQMDNTKASLINKKKARKQRTLFKAKQSSKNEPTPQVLDADLTDLIHVNNLTTSKLKSSDQM